MARHAVVVGDAFEWQTRWTRAEGTISDCCAGQETRGSVDGEATCSGISALAKIHWKGKGHISPTSMIPNKPRACGLAFILLVSLCFVIRTVLRRVSTTEGEF